MSQLRPAYPGMQLQLYLPPAWIQLAPFLHGELSQMLISEISNVFAEWHYLCASIRQLIYAGKVTQNTHAHTPVYVYAYFPYANMYV